MKGCEPRSISRSRALEAMERNDTPSIDGEKDKGKKGETTANGGNGREIETGKQIVTIYGKMHERGRELEGKNRKIGATNTSPVATAHMPQGKQRRASRIEKATAARTPPAPEKKKKEE